MNETLYIISDKYYSSHDVTGMANNSHTQNKISKL